MDDLVIETLRFFARESQVRVVRRWVGKLLDGHPQCDDAVAVASELAANAVMHSRSGAGGTFEVTVVIGPGETWLYVIDGGSAESVPHIPHQRQADEATSGRGLEIVSVLSSRWGYEPGRNCGMTWCQLAQAS